MRENNVTPLMVMRSADVRTAQRCKEEHHDEVIAYPARSLRHSSHSGADASSGASAEAASAVCVNSHEKIGVLTHHEAFDDLTGLSLERDKVLEACNMELEYINSKQVWKKIPRAEAIRNGWRVVKARWIDVNKGDDQNPCIRSRFVAKEYNDSVQEGLFAGTPPCTPRGSHRELA